MIPNSPKNLEEALSRIEELRKKLHNTIDQRDDAEVELEKVREERDSYKGRVRGEYERGKAAHEKGTKLEKQNLDLQYLAEFRREALERLKQDALCLLRGETVRNFDETLAEVDLAIALAPKLQAVMPPPNVVLERLGEYKE